MNAKTSPLLCLALILTFGCKAQDSAEIEDEGVKEEATSSPSTTAAPAAAKDEPEGKVYGSPEEKDLDLICTEITNLVEAKDVYADIEDQKKQHIMARRVNKGLSSRAVIDAFEYLEVIAPDKRYDALKVTAEESKVEGWSCPAIETLWN